MNFQLFEKSLGSETRENSQSQEEQLAGATACAAPSLSTCTTHGTTEPLSDCQTKAAESPADKANDPKANRRQFFACTRAEPMRSSQTCAAR